jgi:hypothetical protein
MLNVVMIVLLASGNLMFGGFDSYDTCQKEIPSIVKQVEYEGSSQTGPRKIITRDAFCVYYKVK